MSEARRTFLPAAGHDWLLPLYDPLLWLLGANSIRRELVAQAALEPGQRVLDIGCGTGSLLVVIKRLYPEVEAVGLDPDPKALARARRKAERAGVPVQLDQGFSDELPYPAESFERVFSSFMLHHLKLDEKQSTLRQTLRVLKPGGSLHLVDFAGAAERSGHIPELMREAGFPDPREVAHHRLLLFGRVARYEASGPS